MYCIVYTSLYPVQRLHHPLQFSLYSKGRVQISYSRHQVCVCVQCTYSDTMCTGIVTIHLQQRLKMCRASTAVCAVIVHHRYFPYFTPQSAVYHLQTTIQDLLQTFSKLNKKISCVAGIQECCLKRVDFVCSTYSEFRCTHTSIQEVCRKHTSYMFVE